MIYERLVLKALEHPKYYCRTVSGISKELGIPKQDVWEVLKNSDKVVVLHNTTGYEKAFVLKSRMST